MQINAIQRREVTSHADSFEFFAYNTKLPIMAMLLSKDFTAAKKVTSSGVQPDDHWIKSLLLILLG